MPSTESAVEYLATTRIGEKGQLTVPKEFREDLGLDVGAPFAVLRLGDALLLMPEQRRFEQLCRRLSQSLARMGVTEKKALSTLPEVRQRLYSRRYAPKNRAVSSSHHK